MQTTTAVSSVKADSCFALIFPLILASIYQQ